MAPLYSNLLTFFIFQTAVKFNSGNPSDQIPICQKVQNQFSRSGDEEKNLDTYIFQIEIIKIAAQILRIQQFSEKSIVFIPENLVATLCRRVILSAPTVPNVVQNSLICAVSLPKLNTCRKNAEKGRETKSLGRAAIGRRARSTANAHQFCSRRALVVFLYTSVDDFYQQHIIGEH